MRVTFPCLVSGPDLVNKKSVIAINDLFFCAILAFINSLIKRTNDKVDVSTTHLLLFICYNAHFKVADTT